MHTFTVVYTYLERTKVSDIVELKDMDTWYKEFENHCITEGVRKRDLQFCKSTVTPLIRKCFLKYNVKRSNTVENRELVLDGPIIESDDAEVDEEFNKTFMKIFYSDRESFSEEIVEILFQLSRDRPTPQTLSNFNVQQ